MAPVAKRFTISLAGSTSSTGIAFDGVGIPDCVHAAQETADAVLDSLAKPSIAAA